MKKSGDNNKKGIEIKKPIKFAAYSGVSLISVFFIFAIINQIIVIAGLENLLVISSIISSFLVTFFSMSFLYGFVMLGKRFDNKLLVILSYVMVIILILSLIFSLWGNSLFDFTPLTTDPVFQEYITSQDINKQINFEDLSPNAQEFIINFTKVIVFIVVFFSLYSILFGVAIIRLREKVRYSKTVGILDIIAGLTFIIIIGIFVKIIAFILEIMMFFDASRKFENSKITKKK